MPVHNILAHTYRMRPTKAARCAYLHTVLEKESGYFSRDAADDDDDAATPTRDHIVMSPKYAKRIIGLSVAARSQRRRRSTVADNAIRFGIYFIRSEPRNQATKSSRVAATIHTRVKVSVAQRARQSWVYECYYICEYVSTRIPLTQLCTFCV